MEPLSGWTPAFHDRFGCGSFWWHWTVTPYTSCSRIYSEYYPRNLGYGKAILFGVVHIYTRGFQCLYSTTKWIKMGKFPNLAYQQYLELGFPFENLDWGLFVFTHRPGHPDPNRRANSTGSKVEGWKDAVFCMKKYGQALGGEFYLECLGWFFSKWILCLYSAFQFSLFCSQKSPL